MIVPKRYSKSPLVEALLDIRVQASEDDIMSKLAAVGDAEQTRYPNRSKRFELSAPMVLTIGEGEPESSAVQVDWVGYTFASEDGRHLFHAQKNGFTCNHLTPYSGWAAFREEARQLWTTYLHIATPASITRIALRYINKIDLPGGSEFSHYFKTYPEVSADMPQLLAGLLMRLVIPHLDIGATLILHQSMLNPQEDGTTPIILDLDLFKFVDLRADSDELWDWIEQLHDREFASFEACLTDKMKEFID